MQPSTAMNRRNDITLSNMNFTPGSFLSFWTNFHMPNFKNFPTLDYNIWNQCKEQANSDEVDWSSRLIQITVSMTDVCFQSYLNT